MVVWLLVLCALTTIAMISVVNTLTFPRLSPSAPAQTPRVSLLIPARNEAGVIEGTVARLLSQGYPDYELIVLDDESTDGTAERAHQAAAGDPRFTVMAGKPLPDGWSGKNWANHQLSQRANGDILVFADADVRWEPEALSAVVNLIDQTGADTFSVWPTQETQTWAERLVVPMMMFVIIGYLPEICVRFNPHPAFAAANGQCLVFGRKAYEHIGGHQVVRSNIIEDVGLAWETKRKGLRLVMALGNRLITARMYTGWKEVREGFAKNILAGHDNKPVLLLLSAVFHWLLFLVPWIWLATGWTIHLGPGWPLLPLALVGLGTGIRLLSAIATHQRPLDAFLLPLSIALMTLIAGQSLWWYFRHGGPEWKGRTVIHRA